jgi:hypothetical protein
MGGGNLSCAQRWGRGGAALRLKWDDNRERHTSFDEEVERWLTRVYGSG